MENSIRLQCDTCNTITLARLDVSGKLKVAPVHTIQAYGALYVGELSASHPGRFLHWASAHSTH
jgi:hypothetical protein